VKITVLMLTVGAWWPTLAQAQEPATRPTPSAPAPSASPVPVSTAEPYWSFGIDFEQDSKLMPKTDEDYTQGTEIAVGGWRPRRAPIVRYGFDALRWLDKGVDFVERHLPVTRFRDSCPASEQKSPMGFVPECEPVGSESVYVSHEVSFGVTAFTPRKGYPAVEGPGCEFRGCVLARTEPIYHDRPYASLTYLQFERTMARGRVAYTSDLTVGALGLQIAKVVQTALHDEQTKPGGWRHQISNRGEPTAAVSTTVKLLAAAVPWRSMKPEADALSNYWDATQPRKRYADLTVDNGLSAGFYTRYNGGALLRVGYIQSAFWAASRGPIQYARARAPNRPRPEIFGLVTGGGSFFVWNSLMQGQFKDSTVTLQFNPDSGENVDTPLRRWVWDWSWGGMGRLPIGKAMIIAGARRYYLSPSFDGPHSRDHGYWGAYLRVVLN
jgi:hypothetical protein